MTCQSQSADSPVVLVIHGGAGVSRADLSAEKERRCREVLAASLQRGFKVIQSGGSSTEAVAEAIVELEDSPLFNAGKGSVLTAAGEVEMDASIMDGHTGRAGAAAGVQGVRNPIRLAREVMDHTRHVMLGGRGAEAFARERGLAMEPAGYFIVPERLDQLRRAREKEGRKADHQVAPPNPNIGTVGAVALDKHGHLAAGTSTGGMVNKRHGRIGDSPIIGAGTYAENGVVAVSCTGHGEFFIRSVVAYDVAARMKYQKASVSEAADEVIHTILKNHGGDGGLIALDAKGQVATPFNTPGMYHGYIRADGSMHIGIFKQ